METNKPLIIPPNILSTCRRIKGKPCSALEWSQNGSHFATCTAPDSCHCTIRAQLPIQSNLGEKSHTLRHNINPFMQALSALWPL